MRAIEVIFPYPFVYNRFTNRFSLSFLATSSSARFCGCRSRTNCYNFTVSHSRTNCYNFTVSHSRTNCYNFTVSHSTQGQLELTQHSIAAHVAADAQAKAAADVRLRQMQHRCEGVWSHVTVINHMSHVVACHTHESHVTQADAEGRDGELKTQETNHKPQTSNHRPQSSNHKPQTTNHKPQTSNHKPQTTNHKPQTTNHHKRLTVFCSARRKLTHLLSKSKALRDDV